jgi:hypothetical protein
MPGQAEQGRAASDKLAAMFLGLANEEDGASRRQLVHQP